MIFLLGFMGCGKSTIGKELALKLGLPFQDLDDIIVKSEGEEIKTIFEKKGEAYFRNLEKSVLFALDTDVKMIISLGGGTPCRQENLDFIKRSGISIYLDCSAIQLAKRLKKEMGHRPLLAKLNSSEKLHAFIRQKLKQRKPYYRKADIIIDANHEPERVVLEILRKLTDRGDS